ncbi:TPA: type-F conjugative transfer system pilin assembly protein TrbC [Legionella pneumophila]
MNKLSSVGTLVFLLGSGISSGWCLDGDDVSQIERQALIQAQKYEKEIQYMSKELTKSQQSQKLTQYTTELKQHINRAENISTHLKKVSSVVVFLSFSMPEQSLKSWLRQCKISGATPVIRGLINNSFKETMVAIKKLSEQSGTGMQLDPILFQTFHIKQVPAVVFAKDIPECPATMDCKPVDYDVVYGDVSLSYALGKINDAQSSDNAQLTAMIHSLEGALK